MFINIRNADDIVVLARTPRVEERLLESSRRYVDGRDPDTGKMITRTSSTRARPR